MQSLRARGSFHWNVHNSKGRVAHGGLGTGEHDVLSQLPGEAGVHQGAHGGPLAQHALGVLVVGPVVDDHREHVVSELGGHQDNANQIFDEGVWTICNPEQEGVLIG